MPLEFRVRWQRGDRRPKTVIYQTWESAVQKARSVAAIDAVKHDFPRLDEMPDLEFVELQVREVGEWRRHDWQPTATEADQRRLHEHMSWTEPTYSERAADPTPTEVPF